MEEDEIRDLVQVWYHRGRAERDIFSRFVFLWICFNAWLDFRSEESIDGRMIQALVSRKSKMSDLLHAYDNSRKSGTDTFNKSLRALVSLSHQKPIEDSRGKRIPIVILDENDFEKIVRAIYRVRCNLFHGGKSPNRARDQKLVKVSGDILEKWVGNLLNPPD